MGRPVERRTGLATVSIEFKDKVASPPIRSSEYFEKRFNLSAGALQRNQSSLVILRASDKAEISLRPTDHVVGAFGIEIGFIRGHDNVWCWLDRPDLGMGSRLVITDIRIKEMIASRELNEDSGFSIKERDSVLGHTRLAILKRDNFICKYCGTSVDEKSGAIDHFIPVAFGGTSEDHNLQAACRSCNGQGGKWHIPPRFVFGKPWQEWAPGKPRPTI
jgi:hypothetical protein